jgi:6,7-dimethyl-8-ribityllumazine synthase
VEGTMMPDVASNLRFGVILIKEFDEFNVENISSLMDNFSVYGCTPDNLIIKAVPTVHDVVIATQFFAQYTDVDGVVILAPQNRVMGMLSLMNGIVQIQIQWNMVVEIGGAECAENVVEMVAMQSEMEMEAPDMVNGQQSFS